MKSSDTMPPITTRTHIRLPIADFIRTLAIVGGIIGVFCVAQYQINKHERRLELLESDSRLLHRLEERIDAQKNQLDRIERLLSHQR